MATRRSKKTGKETATTTREMATCHHGKGRMVNSVHTTAVTRITVTRHGERAFSKEEIATTLARKNTKPTVERTIGRETVTEENIGVFKAIATATVTTGVRIGNHAISEEGNVMTIHRDLRAETVRSIPRKATGIIEDGKPHHHDEMIGRMIIEEAIIDLSENRRHKGQKKREEKNPAVPNREIVDLRVSGIRKRDRVQITSATQGHKRAQKTIGVRGSDRYLDLE
jgi:hypothetical protein